MRLHGNRLCIGSLLCLGLLFVAACDAPPEADSPPTGAPGPAADAAAGETVGEGTGEAMDHMAEEHAAMDQSGGEGAAADSGIVAVPFAEEIFRANTGDYGVSFGPDGESIFFTRSVTDGAGEAIYVARRNGDGWSEPEIAPFSGDYHDKEPFVAPDGGRLYFASKRPVRGFGARDDFDIWYVDRRGTGWGEPVHAETLASAYNDDYPAVAADGTVAFARDDDAGNLDLWLADGVAGAPREPRRFGRPINSVYADADPWIAPDGGRIIFSSPRIGETAEGQGDLWVIERLGEAWTAPVNLGPTVNSIAHEYGPALSPDGSALFYSRGFGGTIWTVPTAVLDGLQ